MEHVAGAPAFPRRHEGPGPQRRASSAPVCPAERLLISSDAAPLSTQNGPVMLPISEKYNDLGTIIVGKIESGRIYKGDTLLMMPNRTSVEVTTIYDEVNEELEAAFSGDNVRIRLKGVTDEDVTPGYVLTTPQKPIKTTTQFQAQLAILESKSIICAGYSCVMHAHTAAEEVTLVVSLASPGRSVFIERAAVADLLRFRNFSTTSRPRPAASRRSLPNSPRQVRCVRPPEHRALADLAPSSSLCAHPLGQQIIALIETTQTVCLEKFADYPQLGRFTLRDEGKTIAIGKVTKVGLLPSTSGLDAPELTSLMSHLQLISQREVNEAAADVAALSLADGSAAA